MLNLNESHAINQQIYTDECKTMTDASKVGTPGIQQILLDKDEACEAQKQYCQDK